VRGPAGVRWPCLAQPVGQPWVHHQVGGLPALAKGRLSVAKPTPGTRSPRPFEATEPAFRAVVTCTTSRSLAALRALRAVLCLAASPTLPPCPAGPKARPLGPATLTRPSGALLVGPIRDPAGL
jgi:hypothetical protein